MLDFNFIYNVTGKCISISLISRMSIYDLLIINLIQKDSSKFIYTLNKERIIKLNSVEENNNEISEIDLITIF